jgi:hypothetical protein
MTLFVKKYAQTVRQAMILKENNSISINKFFMSLSL